MISRGLLWFIALAFIALLAVAWWGARYPANVVVINQAGPLRDVRVTTGGQEIAIGELRPGESRSMRIPSGDRVMLDFRSAQTRHWTSPETTTPAQSLVITISPDERVSARSGLAR